MSLDIKKIREDLHQIPETGFNEIKTSKYLKDVIDEVIRTSNNKKIKVTSVAKTGWVVYIPSKQATHTYAWRTDIDGLAIQEQNKTPFKSKCDGYGHLCGHDVHMSYALGLLDYLAHTDNKQNYVILFQPAEEGGGGAKVVYDSKILQSYKIDELYACHVSPDYKPGEIATNNNLWCLGAIGIEVEVIGRVAHGSEPNKGIDAIVVASQFVLQVQNIISRAIDPRTPNVITFGVIDGTKGTPNSINGNVKLSGTIRYVNKDNGDFIKTAILNIVEGLEISTSAKINVKFSEGTYLPVINNEVVANKFISFSKSYKDVEFINSQTRTSSEDFGYLASKFPSTIFWVGVGNMGNKNMALHSPLFLPQSKDIHNAIKFIIDYFKYLDRQ